MVATVGGVVGGAVAVERDGVGLGREGLEQIGVAMVRIIRLRSVRFRVRLQ
jgi:hypothetical protein